jgi:hypothetical protein
VALPNNVWGGVSIARAGAGFLNIFDAFRAIRTIRIVVVLGKKHQELLAICNIPGLSGIINAVNPSLAHQR